MLAAMNITSAARLTGGFSRVSSLRSVVRDGYVRSAAAALAVWTAGPGRAGESADGPRGADSWGVRSQGWFWVNGTPVAWVDTYCGTYKYDVTDLVQAGTQAVVVAEVNNVVPSRKGLFSAVHRFGGLYRDVELEATPDARIDYAWVRGDFDGQAAEVHATIAWDGAAGAPADPVLRTTLKTADGQPAGVDVRKVAVDPATGRAEVVVRIPPALFRPWSPDAPSLYHADLELCDGARPLHGWTERFGVRKLEVRGDRFFLNNAPFFVRGYGDDAVYPLTLMSPASREEHLRHLRIARAAGFVYVRLHTHCELPEFFEAADEAGILVQPEMPYYGDYPTEAFAFDPLRDLEELVTHYRRHVSLATYCTGNEGRLAAAGLNRRWGDACQDAAHGLQRHYQKRGIEAARMDPACDGYSFWTVVDVMVSQGETYSAQGLFNAFWETKPNGATPETFRAFNGETALLLAMERE
ncbi:MAG: hypothetical protein BWK77_04240, partial [Verrucomicrobia bacterium A1]